jgi:hypothetical protein
MRALCRHRANTAKRPQLPETKRNGPAERRPAVGGDCQVVVNSHKLWRKCDAVAVPSGCPAGSLERKARLNRAIYVRVAGLARELQTFSRENGSLRGGVAQ